MTYRERRMARAERLREWAGKRESAATATLNSYPELRRDWAFITQPGHIPLRARMNAADDRAFASLDKAASMTSRAAEIERQADRAIYSDDPDAPERIRERIEELEAKRARMTTVNKLYKKGDAAGLAALGVDLEKLRATMAARESWRGTRPFEGYELSNLGGNISRLRKRLKDVEAVKERETATEAAGGLLVTRYPEHGWATVRFVEKPERAVLEALRSAGYRFGGGQWSGYLEKLPEVVVGMEAELNGKAGA